MLIRLMQIMGVVSLFLCVFCMFVLFANNLFFGKIVFGAALLALLGSLGISIYEIQLSSKALNLQLKDIEEDLNAENLHSL